MTDLVTVHIENRIATLTMDDGKANAMALTMTDALNTALDRAEHEADAVILRGRPGILSGGFDLKLIQGNDAPAREAMRSAGMALLERLFLLPQPLVIACTGHAVAGGALMLLTGDVRIGTKGDYKIGLNEVAINRVMPIAGVELARARLTAKSITDALLLSKIYAPVAASEAGYLDAVVEPSQFDETIKQAASNLAKLDRAAYAGTKHNLRQPIVERMRSR